MTLQTSPAPGASRTLIRRAGTAGGLTPRCRWPGACVRAARGVRRSVAPAGPRLGPADGDRAGPRALDDPVRTAGLRQDDARPDPRGALRGGLRGAERRRRRAGGGAGGDRARPAPTRARRHEHGPVPRRDPPLQQGPAGRAAAGRRGRAGDADRGHHREPGLRGQRRAAVARTRCTRCRRWPAEIVTVLRRAAASLAEPALDAPTPETGETGDPDQGAEDRGRGRTKRSSSSPPAAKATRAPR